MSFFLFGLQLPDVSADVARSATSTYIDVSDGQLQDGSGNAVVLDSSGTDADGFDHIKNDTPSGRLRYDNGTFTVGGSGSYKITNGVLDITDIESPPSSTGTLYIDGNGRIQLEYEETTTTRKRVDSTIQDVANFPVSVSKDVPSDGSNVDLLAAAKVKETVSTSSCIDCTAGYDTSGDGIADQSKSFTECGGDTSNTEKIVDTVGTGQKAVEINLSSNNLDSDSDFDRSTAAIEWDDTTTTTEYSDITLI